MLRVALKRCRLSARNGWLLGAWSVGAALSAASVWVGWIGHQERVDLYEGSRIAQRMKAEDAAMYVRVEIGFERPPTPLSLISRGVGEDLGVSARIRGRYGEPELARRDRPRTGAARGLDADLAWTLALVLGFTGVFAGHGVINGERRSVCLAAAAVWRNGEPDDARPGMDDPLCRGRGRNRRLALRVLRLSMMLLRFRDGCSRLGAAAALVAAAGAAVPTSAPAVAQTEPAGRSGLEYAAARIRYEEAEKKLRRAEELFENDLLSEAELDTEKAQLRLADLELAQAVLELIAADPEVVLRAARKYRRADGEARVELELVARWSSGVEAAAVEQSGGSLDLPLPTGVSNVIVSLKTVRGHREGVLLEPTIVSVPYEQRVPLMPFDEPTTVDFGLLLGDVEELLVELRYNHQVHHRQVLLGKRSGAREPLVVRSDQLALDVELGEGAAFVLDVERFDAGAATYRVRLEEAVSVTIAPPAEVIPGG